MAEQKLQQNNEKVNLMALEYLKQAYDWDINPEAPYLSQLLEVGSVELSYTDGRPVDSGVAIGDVGLHDTGTADVSDIRGTESKGAIQEAKEMLEEQETLEDLLEMAMHHLRWATGGNTQDTGRLTESELETTTETRKVTKKKELSESLFDEYVPRKLNIKGVQPHPLQSVGKRCYGGGRTT